MSVCVVICLRFFSSASDFPFVFLYCSVFSAIVFSAFSIGQVMSFAPDYSKALLAAAHIFNLLDLKPSIDTTSEDGIKPVGYAVILMQQ